MPLVTEYRTMELSLFAFYVSRRQLTSKVRVFIDYLVEAVGAKPPWEQWRRSGTAGRGRSTIRGHIPASTDRSR